MNSKLITIPIYILKEILPFLKNTQLEKKINDLLENTGKYQTQNISYFPKDGKVERIVDGDTVVLHNGTIVRYVGRGDTARSAIGSRKCHINTLNNFLFFYLLSRIPLLSVIKIHFRLLNF